MLHHSERANVHLPVQPEAVPVKNAAMQLESPQEEARLFNIRELFILLMVAISFVQVCVHAGLSFHWNNIVPHPSTICFHLSTAIQANLQRKQNLGVKNEGLNYFLLN